MGRKPTKWDTDNLDIPEDAEVLDFTEVIDLADQLPCPECKQSIGEQIAGENTSSQPRSVTLTCSHCGAEIVIGDETLV